MSDVKVIFEDSDILVIDKPAGLVVTPADTIQDTTLSDILIRDFKINLDRGGVVHRIDKDTSGLLVVAKTQKALDNLQAQFKHREVKKEYLALVHGFFENSRVVSGAIARNPGNREKFIVLDDKDARAAETEFIPIHQMEMIPEQIEKTFPGFSKIQFKKLFTNHYSLFTLVAARPTTGRTHQIRVHLKHIGFPIVSDEKYGGRKTVRLDRRWCPRQFLHAHKLEIKHPSRGERMEFISELPEDLMQALSCLSNTEE